MTSSVGRQKNGEGSKKAGDMAGKSLGSEQAGSKADKASAYRHGVHWTDRNTCRFALWAPDHDVVLLAPEDGSPIPMQVKGDGWHVLDIVNPPDSMTYRYQLGDRLVPDPVSHFQPQGIDGPSAVVPHHTAKWQHPNPTHSLNDLIIYELHIGTFTHEGTFDAAIGQLADVAALGVTAVEVMPVAQFSGERNWGYDGVFPFAVQHSYGGPEGLVRFVDAAHELGLSVILDVVYNHLGPEGNVLPQYGGYLSADKHTPWGPNPDFSRKEVREYVVQNVLHWLIHYKIDGLRLDAVQCILDDSRRHILRQIADVVQGFARRSGRVVHLIAESDENDMGLVRHSPTVAVAGKSGESGGLVSDAVARAGAAEGRNAGERNGPRQVDGASTSPYWPYNLDAQWNDDFHHALHAALTGEQVGFYSAYGGVETLASVMRNGFHYRGQYNGWKRRAHGSDPQLYPHVSPAQFVAFSQNHDMVGNRPNGERLWMLMPQAVRHDAARCAATLTLLGPFTPLLFMGEEYGETAPFPFVTSYAAEGLKRAVTRGRNNELLRFGWGQRGMSPSQAATFRKARLQWELRNKDEHVALLEWYRQCIRLRREHPAWESPDFSRQTVCVPTRGVLAVGVWAEVAECDGVDAAHEAEMQELQQRGFSGHPCWVIANCTGEPVEFRMGMLPQLGGVVEAEGKSQGHGPDVEGASAASLNASAGWYPHHWRVLLDNCAEAASELAEDCDAMLPPYGVVVMEML